LGMKNQLDASTGPLGVRVPPDILEEAALVTNGFSARYGQALSGLINVVTKDGGDRWRGRAAYETDRPAPDGWDYGLDRVVAQADGPLGRRIRLVAVADATGRFGAFTGRSFHIVGESLARAQDTAAARAAIPGLTPPAFSERTPWGVPAFFLGGGSRGEVAWNRFRELRGQIDADWGLGPDADL